MTAATRRDLLVGLAVLALAIAVPIVFQTRYVVTQATLFFIWAIVVTQWNLVLGVGGIFSLAQMAIFACGAYVTAVLGYYFDVSLWVAMPLAGLGAMVFSVLIGLACLRLRGPYVALLTLATAQVCYIYIINDTDCFTNPPSGCMPLLGGVRGISKIGDLGFRDLLGTKFYIAHYYVGLALLTAATVFSTVIIRGPIGLAFQALRDNPGYAVSRGIGRFKYQVWLFALSAFFTGIAGAFYAAHFKVIGPDIFSLTLLLFLISMIVVGGLGTIWGPLLGSALLMIADEGAKEISEYRNIGLGVILVLFVTLLPRGLVGALTSLWGAPRARERGP